jgi:hypothetical protein
LEIQRLRFLDPQPPQQLELNQYIKTSALQLNLLHKNVLSSLLVIKNDNTLKNNEESNTTFKEIKK